MSRVTESAQKILILGAGGHARVVLATLAAMGKRASGYIAPEAAKGPWPRDISWLGDDDRLDELESEHVRLVNGLGSIGAVGRRRDVYEVASSKGYRFESLRHPDAVVADDIRVGEGSQILAGSVVQPGCRIGANVILNTGCIVDHDAYIEDHVHVAPGVCVSGNVSVGRGAHLGTGAVIRQGVTIGTDAVIGAGAVVLRDIPDNVTVVGNPARILETSCRGSS